MVIWVVKFPREECKIRNIFGKKSIYVGTQKKIMYFVNGRSGEVGKSAKIELSKSIFYVKNQTIFFKKKII